MKAKTYYIALFTCIGGFIAVGFIVGVIFPGIPGYAYLGAAIAFGLLFLFVLNPLLFKKTTEPVSDERLVRISEKAAFLTYRIVVGIGILATAVIFQIKDEAGYFPIIARTSYCIIMAIIAIYQISYAILKRKR